MYTPFLPLRQHETNKMEATVEKYKRRLEDMAELRQQVKELDDLNSKYLDQMLKLESTAKTIPTLTMKIEQYKDQVWEQMEITTDRLLTGCFFLRCCVLR